jgi:hypothetical protein
MRLPLSDPERVSDQVLVAEQQILIHQPRLRTPGGVPNGTDRARWNAHHSVRHHPSLEYFG